MQHPVRMTTSTSYAASRAARTEGLVRAVVLAGALAMLVTSLNGALRVGAHKVATALEVTSVR